MSDEEDYMSDAFLLSCSTAVSESYGLKKTRAEKRSYEIMKKKQWGEEEQAKRKIGSIRAIEGEQRNKGLNQPLEKDNKGFTMLEKMGYKAGRGIGKSEQGIVNPIGIDIKMDRKGIGMKQHEKKMCKKMVYDDGVEQKKEMNVTSSIEEFRMRKVAQVSQHFMHVDFRRSQQACERCDLKAGIMQPLKNWYWEITPSEDNSDSSDEEFHEKIKPTLDEKLDELTKYLRRNYFYCVWCGVEYTDNNDLEKNCDGDTRNAHDC